jgi:Sec-independent protein translocase protein TatA
MTGIHGIGSIGLPQLLMIFFAALVGFGVSRLRH